MNGTKAPAGGGWEHFPHQADVGVRGRGPTLEAAFEGAARALTAAVADLEAVEPRTRVAIECQAPDREILLVAWLDALVFEMATRHMLFSRFAVRIDGGRLCGEAWGEAVDPARHGTGAEAKGATFTALAVTRDDGTWTAQCVVDV